jgi:hypothetical protein
MADRSLLEDVAQIIGTYLEEHDKLLTPLIS